MPPRPPRRRPWVLALTASVLLAAVAAGVAVDQRDVAAQWRAQAQALEAERDMLAVSVEELLDQVDEASAALRVSEADVTRLEARLRELAEEKARAEDTATTVRVERDAFRSVSEQIAGATTALDGCVDRLFELQRASVAAFNRSAAGEPVDVGPLNEQADQVAAFCDDARAAARRAGAAAERLAGP